MTSFNLHTITLNPYKMSINKKEKRKINFMRKNEWQQRSNNGRVNVFCMSMHFYYKNIIYIPST